MTKVSIVSSNVNLTAAELQTTGYWSRAIASNPSTTARAYFLGGFAWFSIPFACGTSLGLSARALGTLPDFPILSAYEVSAGLVAVEAVFYLLGTAGAVLMLLLVFLSVTSVRSRCLIQANQLTKVLNRH